MDIVFFGSSQFSVPFLEAINSSGHNLITVITKTDKIKGRGQKILPNPVKQKAVLLGKKYLEIEKVDSSFLEEFSKINFDISVVVSFGIIFPREIFNNHSWKWLNVHPSLLPEYRGPSPMLSALLDGAGIGGVSINEVVYEVDMGRIYAQTRFKIKDDDNYDRLEEKIVKIGAPLLISVLDLIEQNRIEPFDQGKKGVTYTHKINKEDLKIDWSSPDEIILNKIRAFSRNPGAYCFWKGKRLKILEAKAIKEIPEKLNFKTLKIFKTTETEKNFPGEIAAADNKNGLLVYTAASRIIEINMVQVQGKKVMSSIDFINGFRVNAGDRFE